MQTVSLGTVSQIFFLGIIHTGESFNRSYVLMEEINLASQVFLYYFDHQWVQDLGTLTHATSKVLSYVPIRAKQIVHYH
jgi:hypothetical protein